MTRPSINVAREWVLANDDGSGVGMTPEKIASLTALIERERLEAQIEALEEGARRNCCDPFIGSHQKIIGVVHGKKRPWTEYRHDEGTYTSSCSSRGVWSLQAELKAQLAAKKREK